MLPRRRRAMGELLLVLPRVLLLLGGRRHQRVGLRGWLGERQRMGRG